MTFFYFHFILFIKMKDHKCLFKQTKFCYFLSIWVLQVFIWKKINVCRSKSLNFWKGEQSVHLSLLYKHIFVQASLLIETFSSHWWGPWTSCWMLNHFFQLSLFGEDVAFNCTNLKFLHLGLVWFKFNYNYLLRTGKEECGKLFMYHFLCLNQLRWALFR